MVDLTTYSFKDQKVIKANKGLTPEEMGELGLSKAGTERLKKQMAGEASVVEKVETKANPIKEVKVTNKEKEEIKAIPKDKNVVKVEVVKVEQEGKMRTNAYMEGLQACIVRNLETGHEVRMAFSAAKTLNPKEFKIL